MKRIVIFGMILLMSFGLCACGKKGQGETEENANPLMEMIEPQTESIAEKDTDKIETNYARGNKIEEQTFHVTLRPLGEVTFASYAPDTSLNPLADAVFLIEKEGSVLQELSGVSDNNCRANQCFLQVEAVSFLDYNEDSYDNIIVICSYEPASGPDVGTGYSEIRYYSGNENGMFSYEEQMSADASAALTEITIQTAKSFIGIGNETSLEPWQQAYINYLQQDSDVESQQGYVLIYIDGDEIPELVEIGDCEATGCRIVNFSNGTVHVTQLNRLYFSYIENENLLCNSEGNMDYYYDLVYGIIDGEMTLLAWGYYGAEDNSNVQFDEEGNPIYRYEWNDVEMSKADYEKELNSIYDTSRAKSGYLWDEWYSVDEIITLLENYQR